MLFRDWPIRKKLQTLILTASLSVLLATCAAFVTYEFFAIREDIRGNLHTLAQVTASNSSGALAFQNPEDARSILAALSAEPKIVAAAIYDREGALFALYPDDEGRALVPEAPLLDGQHSDGRYLLMVEPIMMETRHGTLFLRLDMSAALARFRLYVGLALLVVLGAALLALVLARFLQKGISAPIIALAGTARSISRDQDYSVRAHKEGEDEIGLLTDAFNDMLFEIHRSQAQLRRAVAESREAAEQVRKLNAELEDRVTQRTSALQEAVAQMEAFSYSVSHDLRAPLRAMHGYAQALIEDCGDRIGPAGLNYIQRIKKSAERLDRLIQDVLTYSRVSRTDVPFERVELDRLVHDIIQQYPAFQPPKAHILIESPLLEVIGNEALLTQCVSNLLSNSIKFVRPDTVPEVRIWTERTDGCVRLWIEDNGIGIPEEHQERVFRIFERLNSDKTYEGTGIGLAIVKKAIERMGGGIGLKSTVDTGTRFWIKLPCA